jgi:predicted nucleic acid-binding protein
MKSKMGNKIFLDANVLLDHCLQRENYKYSKIIFNKIESGQIRAYINGSIIHILSYILSKVYGSEKTKIILEALIVDLNIVDLPKEIIIQALHSNIEDLEDALQFFSALHYKMDYLITNDNDFIKLSSSSLPIYSTAEYINNDL